MVACAEIFGIKALYVKMHFTRKITMFNRGIKSAMVTPNL